MIATQLFTQSLFDSRDVSLVGGKAANLGRLLRGGFPVPEGFVVTTRANRLARMNSASIAPDALPEEVAEEIRSAYCAMGGGCVAVRSSATAEDMATASMAGQYDTFLNINGESDLLQAVRRCWASLDHPRIAAYLNEHEIDQARVAMAVVVQRQVPADVAGVLFTASPREGGIREMLIEASWGLGESVVSGRVQPDILRIEGETGRVLAATIADKQVQLTAGNGDEHLVEESRRRQPCLRGSDVYRLWQMGIRTAKYFGAPQDMEWAIHADQLYLLQSRPITTFQASQAYEELLDNTRATLRQKSSTGRGPWALHNLAETLPHPTPLTWSVIKRFMSGSGGFGAMYRNAGFEPSTEVNRDGFLDLIAGRIYMDASRASEMFFANFPFAYDVEELKRRPDASQLPPTLPRGSLKSRMKAARSLIAVNEKLRALSVNLDRELRNQMFQEIIGYVESAKTIDLHALSVDALLALWEQHEQMVLESFAPQLLMPSLISGMAMGQLRAFLQEHFWDDDPDSLSQLVSSGGAPDRTVVANSELYEVAKGMRPLETWLKEHGHRAAGEFDLARPRWREQPALVIEMAARLADSDGPMERHRLNAEQVDRQIRVLRGQLSHADRKEFDDHIDRVRRYIAFREDGKDILMLGYDLLRDVALEAGRRLDIVEDIFYLTGEDFFDALRVGFAPLHLIEQRKAVYRAEIQLTLPSVIDAEAIETIGNIAAVNSVTGGHKAFAVSSGSSTGPARILRSPTDASDLGRGYILICPSTDPGWTPLFVNAAGLVLECGGTLSHGAVVAREMGLPAVVLPNATRLFQEGEEIRVNGQTGWVGRVTDDINQPSPASIDTIVPESTHIPANQIPPPSGRKDRFAAKIRNWAALFWTVYLVAFFLAPKHWIEQPTMRLLDLFLWPIVRSWGKPVTVAIIAVGLALVTLLIQKFLTDNRRLLEAKRRAAALKKQADSLPENSRRRAALLGLAAPVQARTLLAALVPIGILLGPMVMPFMWFRQRVEPLAANAPAGSAVQIVATIDANWLEPVRLDLPKSVSLDDTTPTSRLLPNLRKPLERLLSLYRQPRPDLTAPWELQAAPDLARQQTADDLQAYLNAGIPPQGITWMIHPPEEFCGRFPVTVATSGHPPMTLDVILGNDYPPATSIATGPVGSPVKELRIAYPRANQEPIFWRPLASLSESRVRPFRWLASVDVGWLGLYIIVYLPALLALKTLLRIA